MDDKIIDLLMSYIKFYKNNSGQEIITQHNIIEYNFVIQEYINCCLDNKKWLNDCSKKSFKIIVNTLTNLKKYDMLCDFIKAFKKQLLASNLRISIYQTLINNIKHFDIKKTIYDIDPELYTLFNSIIIPKKHIQYHDSIVDHFVFKFSIIQDINNNEFVDIYSKQIYEIIKSLSNKCHNFMSESSSNTDYCVIEFLSKYTQLSNINGLNIYIGSNINDNKLCILLNKKNHNMYSIIIKTKTNYLDIAELVYEHIHS